VRAGAGPQRRRHECRQLLDELSRREHGVRRAVAPAVLEPVEEASIAQPRESLGRDRRVRAVATQAFEAAAVARGDRDVGVDADATHARAALAS